MRNRLGTEGFFQSDFTLGNIGVQVRSDDPAVAQRMQMICAYFGLELTSGPTSGKRLILQLCAKGGEVAIPASAVPVAEQQGITARRDDLHLYLSDGASTVQLDLHAGLATGSVRATRGRPAAACRKDLLIYSLLFLLRYRGLYGLHGAGLVRDGLGCLLVADSDCGKSTLAFSLVRQGWSYLSDDSLLLYQQGDRIEARALRRDLCLDPEAAAYFPEIVPHWAPCPLADDIKQRLDMGVYYPKQMVATCIPHMIIFPEIVPDAGSRLIAVGKTEAFSRLLGQSLCVLFEPDRMPYHVEIISRLVQQARSYRLRAGRDLVRDPALVVSHLADIQRQRRTELGQTEKESLDGVIYG